MSILCDDDGVWYGSFSFAMMMTYGKAVLPSLRGKSLYKSQQIPLNILLYRAKAQVNLVRRVADQSESVFRRLGQSRHDPLTRRRVGARRSTNQMTPIRLQRVVQNALRARDVIRATRSGGDCRQHHMATRA